MKFNKTFLAGKKVITKTNKQTEFNLRRQTKKLLFGNVNASVLLIKKIIIEFEWFAIH